MSAFIELAKHLNLDLSQENLRQAQRLFHGRGHGYANLHHITLDWLPPVVLLTLYAPEPDANIITFADKLLSELPTCKSIQLQQRYLPGAPIEVIRGESISQLVIHEGLLKFHIRLGTSQNIGLFLDIKNGRRWIQAHSKNKRVLNLFAYTCGFSIAAIEGQAKSVMNVDMSSAALNVGRENHRLNQHPLKSVSFAKLNIFKSFSRLKKAGPFDLLICDPPTFQKGSVDIIRDYPKILRRLDQFMAPGALLFLCLNAPELKRSYLLDQMLALAPSYKLIDEIKPPDVFVEVEDKGLKIFCYKHYEEAN